MGINNQQRRAAKKRRTSSTQRSRHDGGPFRRDAPSPRFGIGNQSATIDADLVEHLLMSGGRAAVGAAADPQVVAHVCRALADITGNSESHAATGQRLALPDQVAEGLIVRIIRLLWEHGWQPVDLAHVVRRNSNARVMRLLGEMLDAEAAASGVADRAPAEWVDQLRGLGARGGVRLPVSAPALTRWRLAAGLDLFDGYEHCLTLVGVIIALPPLVAIDPPPSAWGAGDGHARAAANTPNTANGVNGVNAVKMLATVRALLAKAERSEFPAEAEAFTAKAQDLMTRHSIDAAVLSASGHDGSAHLRAEVRTRRVHVDDPYAPEKAQLLGAVGRANSVRVVWFADVAMASIVGFPLDLDLVELLYTSLLIQATRAMADASTSSAHSRSPSFRRAFFMAYAVRIGERLQQARAQAGTEAESTYGSALVPILARRTEAVDERFDELFPGSRPMGSKRIDAAGWHAGRLAADMATLASGQTTLPL